MSLNLKEAFSQHLPNILSPTTLKQTIAEKAKNLAEELNLPEVSLQPITDEELRISKYLSQPPPPQPPLVSPLETVYPTSSIFKDTDTQTTTCKKIYYIEEQTLTDYAAGLPIEDICHSLRATNLIETNDTDDHLKTDNENKTSISTETKPPLTFVNAQLETEEIDSFLLDFNKAKDPLAAEVHPSHNNKSENESSNGSSSEWEFLDN